MAVILPRWEWRTFGPSFGAAERSLAGLEPTSVAESDEIYLYLGARNTAKVRAGLIDIKALVATDGNGLEQWRPALKAAFPLSVADVQAAFEALGLAAPALARDSYTLDELVGELATPRGPLVRVAVHKRRVRHVINGCTAEVTEVVADGIATRSVAIESTDADAVIEAVRSMGLGDFLNASYGRGLAALIAGTPPRYAVIDAGTNSIKFHVGQRADDGTWTRVRDRAEMTRLGDGLEASGAISDEARDRTADAIAAMAAEARQDGVLAIAAVGTAGLRIATNRDAVVEAIRARSGVRVEVISGEEESRLAFIAARDSVGLGAGAGPVAVFDTGGGSTQLTFGHGDRVDERFSVDVGAVRFTQRFALDAPVEPGALAEALAAIATDLGRLDGRAPVDGLVGMGGAVTNLAAVFHGMTAYDPDRVHGTVLTRAEIDRQIELYRRLGSEDRMAIPGLQPGRADVILAGACIVRTVLDKLARVSLTVCDRGLRHGLLAERFGS